MFFIGTGIDFFVLPFKQDKLLEYRNRIDEMHKSNITAPVVNLIGAVIFVS